MPGEIQMTLFEDKNIPPDFFSLQSIFRELAKRGHKLRYLMENVDKNDTSSGSLAGKAEEGGDKGENFK
jgi:hypothetical protein